jgi:hypothetical protein
MMIQPKCPVMECKNHDPMKWDRILEYYWCPECEFVITDELWNAGVETRDIGAHDRARHIILQEAKQYSEKLRWAMANEILDIFGGR